MEEGELENSATKLEGSLNEKKMESAIVEHLIDYSLSVLATEASLLWGVRDAVDSIKDELESMRSFLVDADKKGVGSEGEKTWVANVRDMAYDVEDVIDQFMYHVNSQRIGGRFFQFLHHTIYIPQTLLVRHQLATKLQKINKKIKSIPDVNQRYGVRHIEGTSSKVIRNGLDFLDRKSTRLNSSHALTSRMPSSA